MFGTQIISRLPELLERKSAFDYETYEITEKERAVMKLVADGKSNKEIAGEMFLSEGTIRNYISEILDKLNLRDRTQLAVFYLRIAHKSLAIFLQISELQLWMKI